MSQQNDFKVGDLITAYHKGFHEVKRVYSIPNGRGNDVPQVEYEKRYNDNGTVAKAQKKSCHTAMITEEIELTDVMAEVNKIAKLKEAMELILGREVFMPQVLIIKDFITNRWRQDNFQEYQDISEYAKKLCPDLIGETEEKAKKLINEISGIDYRVTKRDRQPYIITHDLRFNRINLVIENNLVTEASVG